VESEGGETLIKIHPENYRFLQEHIRRQSGIVLDDGKDYLVEARLLPVAMEHGLKTLDDLCTKLRLLSDISLQRKVVEAMTTNETFFFREPAHFEALRSHVIPTLLELRRAEQKLTFWSAAASTGQEAYSLAMLLCEMGLDSWDIRIVGTDISSAVLDRAAAGVYNQVEIERGLPAVLRTKYCTQRSADSWEVKPILRQMTTFRLFDLRFNIRALGPFDVVFCRNVLIYFDQITKSRIVEDIRTALKPGGCLFLGGSEVSLPVGPGFSRAVASDTTFFKSV
jgi:chemotaxis protein methyltransferase CheR